MARAEGKSKHPDEPRMIHVRLDPDLHRRLRIVVAAEDTSLQDWLADAIEKAVLKQWPHVASQGE